MNGGPILASRRSKSSAIKTRRQLREHIDEGPLRPGDALREFVLEAHDLTQDQLALAMGVSRYSINQLANDRRSITAEMALRLGKATSTSPQLWLNLQQNADLAKARRRLARKGELDKVRVLRVAVPEGELYHDVDE